MIDIFIPVLNRPHRAREVYDSITAWTVLPHKVHFICSMFDHDQIEAVCAIQQAHYHLLPEKAGPADYAKKMNLAYHSTQQEWIFLAADDLKFQPGWDTTALALAARADVIGTNDQTNGQVRRGEFGTHCFVRRTYVQDPGASLDGPGSLISEAYDHNFVDRELSHLAQHRGRWAFAKRSIVKHLHPNWKLAPMDDTYRKALKEFRADRELFLRRSKGWGHTGLNEQERKAATTTDAAIYYRRA